MSAVTDDTEVKRYPPIDLTEPYTPTHDGTVSAAVGAETRRRAVGDKAD